MCCAALGPCRVDKRFQLEQAFGTLDDSLPVEPLTDQETVDRLEALFNAASSSEDEAGGLDSAVPDPDRPVSKSVQRKASLKEYVNSFDQATLIETANILSQEAASLVERQSTALFGDVRQLQQQMSEVVGEDASSMDDLMKRIEDAVTNDKVRPCPPLTTHSSVGQRMALLMGDRLSLLFSVPFNIQHVLRGINGSIIQRPDMT